MRIAQLYLALQEVIDSGKFPWAHLLDSTKIILCTGNPQAKILVVGRDLGRDEIEKEQVLVGKAGTKFRKTAKEIGFDPLKDFLMTNTVPLKPKGNKAFPQEVREYFWPVLNHLLLHVRPKFILTLGNEATRMFDPHADGITKCAGMEFEYCYEGKDCAIVIPCAHPSYIERGVSKEEEERVFTSPLQKLRRRYASSNA
jgi:uracil-DNA glycosylase family 4